MPNPPIHEIGSFTDANGNQVTIATDCDGVTVSGFETILLGPEQLDLFVRYIFEAGWYAEMWRVEHAGTGDSLVGLPPIGENLPKWRGDGTGPAG